MSVNEVEERSKRRRGKKKVKWKKALSIQKKREGPKDFYKAHRTKKLEVKVPGIEVKPLKSHDQPKY